MGADVWDVTQRLLTAECLAYIMEGTFTAGG
jgi:hypothetical protein